MTTRELNITKAVLDHLHEQEYVPVTEIQIHAAVVASPLVEQPRASVAELASVLRSCETEKWIAGTPGRFKKQMRWIITDVGEGARISLNE